MSLKEKDTTAQAKNKAARFCTYQERAPLEVRQKLNGYGLKGDELEGILEELTSEGFLNENRFAKSYANGKLRIKKWGRLKIRMGLEKYKIDANCIDSTLDAIPHDDYGRILKQLVDKKWQSLKISDLFIRKHRVAQYMMSKGFEPSLIWEVLKDL